MPPKPQVITLSWPAWTTLIGGGISIVASIWAFTLSVSSDIREIKTELRGIAERHADVQDRVKRIETVYIK